MKKQPDDISFDPTTQEAVLRASICTGETVAGFRDKTGGHFTEVMLIKTPRDLEAFKQRFGIAELKKIY